MIEEMSKRQSDKWFTGKNVLGFILVIASLLWKFGIGSSSGTEFLLVFGFGAFLISEQPFINFLKQAWGVIRGQGNS